MALHSLRIINCILFTLIVFVKDSGGYLVGDGLNVRFSQLLYTDNKYQTLREMLAKKNTKNLMYHCRSDKVDCDMALAKMRYKASKHFYALAKAVVDYVKNKRKARPSGYVGTATFCQDKVCVPDTDPPIVLGGCFNLISCGGNESWYLESLSMRRSSARYF